MSTIYQPDWASRWAIYSPEKVAFKAAETSQTLTYAALNRGGNRLAYHLQTDYGIGKGDRIAILAENDLTYLLLFVAAQKLGCILVPLNYRLATSEIDYLLQDVAPKLLLRSTALDPKLEKSKEVEHLPAMAYLESFGDYALAQTPLAADVGVAPPVLTADDPVFILYTSGTTGFPKGALYTHGMLFWNSINTAMSLLVNTESRTVNCMPPFHTGGWNVLTTPFLHHGGYSCLLRKFDPERVLQLLVEEQVTVFMAVPTMLKMMADLPAFATADLSCLSYVIVGGEPMPVPLIERWHAKGVPIRQGYGMTEVGPNLTSLHQDDAVRKQGSIGRPNYYVQTRIVDDTGARCGPNQAGELQLRGPMVSPGYWRKPEATADSFQDGWFRTGDRVKEDEEGYLYVVDRIKNMFISGGENVYPAEIERVILTCPGVAEVVVVGVADERWGEVGCAFVVATEAAQLNGKTLQTFCQERLAKFKVPKHWRLLSTLPKSDTGKLDRRALAAQFTRPAAT